MLPLKWSTSNDLPLGRKSEDGHPTSLLLTCPGGSDRDLQGEISEDSESGLVCGDKKTVST